MKKRHCCNDRKGLRRQATDAARRAAPEDPTERARADWPDPDDLLPWDLISLVVRKLKDEVKDGALRLLVCVPFLGPDSDRPKLATWVPSSWYADSAEGFGCIKLTMKLREYRRLYKDLLPPKRMKLRGDWDDYDAGDFGPAHASYPASLEPAD